jgi:hypothetical protein
LNLGPYKVYSEILLLKALISWGFSRHLIRLLNRITHGKTTRIQLNSSERQLNSTQLSWLQKLANSTRNSTQNSTQIRILVDSPQVWNVALKTVWLSLGAGTDGRIATVAVQKCTI